MRKLLQTRINQIDASNVPNSDSLAEPPVAPHGGDGVGVQPAQRSNLIIQIPPGPVVAHIESVLVGSGGFGSQRRACVLSVMTDVGRRLIALVPRTRRRPTAAMSAKGVSSSGLFHTQ